VTRPGRKLHQAEAGSALLSFNAYPDGQPFQNETGHPFQGKPATDSGLKAPLTSQAAPLYAHASGSFRHRLLSGNDRESGELVSGFFFRICNGIYLRGIDY